MRVVCLTRVRQDGVLYMPGETITDVTTDRAGQLVRSRAARIIPEPEGVKAVGKEDQVVEEPKVPEPEVKTDGFDSGEPILRNPTSRRSVGSRDGIAKAKSVGNGRRRSKTVQAEG